MKWNCYINRDKGDSIETTKEVLDLPNTSKCDNRFACLEASKKFGVKEDDILCLPTCTYDCTETSHSYECDEKCKQTDPVITSKSYPYPSKRQ
jgi:copper oxidase (laccase) domain-containing protein